MAVVPVLKRFEIVVYKNKGTQPDPTAQVPAEATVDFYRQGATLSVAESNIPNAGTRVITVYHRGALEKDDTLIRCNLAGEVFPNDTFEVDELSATDPNQLTVLNTSGGPLSLVVGDRLVPTNDRPVAYDSPVGDASTGPTYITTSAADGRGACYLAPYRFDYIVSGTGLTARLFRDAVGSFVMRS